MKKSSDAFRRGFRTLIVCVAACIPGVPGLAALFNVPAGRVAQVTGLFTFIVGFGTYVLNALEDKGVIPAVLKAPASSGEDPVPEPDAVETP